MKAPVARLKKTEIIWLSNNNCKHGHSYLEHYSCYLKDYPQGYDNIKSCVWDIEVNNLNADYGLMLSYAILDKQTGEIHGRTINKKEVLSEDMDKKLVKDCINELSKYDHIITYYGDRFDWPYLRARALRNDLDFPAYGALNTTDLYFVIRSKFKISRRSLDNACRFLLDVDEKTRVDAKYWIRAIQGNQEALDYIWEHNAIDVDLTNRLYDKVIHFKKNISRSI